MNDVTVTAPAGRFTGVVDQDVATFHSIPFATFPGPFEESVPLRKAGSVDARVPRPDEVALTVTAPASARHGLDFPVIVYIHGGRFEHGTHEDPRADGTYNARHGIVQVQLGYRVGLEGFLRFRRDEPNRFRGIDDLQLGLEWVQRNIESFGGDPTNVTVMGQSAGATSALWLARRDHYRGAFRRLLVMSPCFPRQRFEERESTLRTALGKPLTVKALTELHAKKPAKLAKAYKRFRTRYVLDMALGPAPLDCDQMADVPIVVGSTRDEFYDIPSGKKIDAGNRARWWTKLLSTRMGMTSGAFDYWWNKATAIDPKRPAGRLISDAQARRWVAQVAGHAPGETWMLEFTNSEGIALHCAELRYLFGVHAEKNPDSQSGRAAARVNAWMREYATTGEPGWEPYGEDHVVQEFDMATGATTAARRTLDYVSNSFPVTFDRDARTA